MHYHRMLIFWLMTTVRSLSCGQEASEGGVSSTPETELIAAKRAASVDAGIAEAPGARKP